MVPIPMSAWKARYGSFKGARQIFEILKIGWDMAGFLSAYNTGRQERASCPPRMSTKR